MKFNWEKAGRIAGDLKLGDTLWDQEGKIYMVARHEKPELHILSIATATQWLKENKFLEISIDERIFTL